MKLRILVVDADPAARGEIEHALQQAGFETRGAADRRAAAELALAEAFDVCLSDGLPLLSQLRASSPETEMLVVADAADRETALAALRLGAVDVLLRPFEHEELLAKLQRIAEHRRLVLENRNLRRAAESANPGPWIADSPAMQRLLALLERVAALPSRVLIRGERGTGKELVARALHARSPRKDAPFVPLHCAALSEAELERELFGVAHGPDNEEGLLRTAGEGTLFLHEPGALPPAIQTRLLRALESGEVQPAGSTRRVPVHARIVAATSRELPAELRRLLAEVELAVPPLRERREDIPRLAEQLWRAHSRALGQPSRGIAPEALQLLASGDWPGNVRELSNAIERAALARSGPELRAADLQGLGGAGATRDFERAHILRVIEDCGGNKRKAAKLLGIGVTSLYRKLGDSPEEDAR